jgi:hypothetical protein
MVEDKKISVSDSVIQGSITNIGTNIQATERVTCKTCLASGNITIFVCNEVSCTNTFCEHCKNNEFPKKCQNCLDQIANQRIEELKLRQQQLAEAEEVRLQNELELRRQREAKLAEEKRQKEAKLAEENEFRKQRFLSSPAKLMRSKVFIIPLLQILSWYILLNGAFKIPGDHLILNKSIIVLASLMVTYTILFLAVLSNNSDTNYISLAESGYASNRAMIYVMSPMISMVLLIILNLFTQIFISTLCAIIFLCIIIISLLTPS